MCKVNIFVFHAVTFVTLGVQRPASSGQSANSKAAWFSYPLISKGLLSGNRPGLAGSRTVCGRAGDVKISG
jgi:hypothetical protein